ncbi:hypothetical protein Q5687_19455, partial [Microcoleus sp. AT10_D2]|uniref:hypothetical protein n=1 Tax=unclassified Microcoleus TaxID=2642155 RepID=UPI002FCEE011
PHKYHFYEQARCLFHTSTIFMNRQDACIRVKITGCAFFILLDNFSAGDRTSNVKCLKAVFVK